MRKSIITILFTELIFILLTSCAYRHEPILIKSIPSGANVEVSGKQWGKTPCTMKADDGFSWAPDLVLVLKKEGFKPKNKTIEADIPWFPQGTNYPREIVIHLEPEMIATYKQDFTKSEKTVFTQKQSSDSVQNWAVIIGISTYQHSGQNGLSNLIFADDDAKAFARSLHNLGWNDNHIKLFTNEEATEKNIRIALESWLTKAGPNDQVVLFWAGHGFPDPEDPEKVYFACYDTNINIPATGYRMDRVRTVLEERKAKNVILLADTCHAGKLITRGERGLSIVPQIDKMQREQKVPKGWIFMVGADADRQAIEHTSWKNGAFTHCLINALSGNADGYLSSGDKDSIVTMGELRAYLNNAMPYETQKVLGVAKRPVITTSTGDPDIWNLTLQPTK